jgi:hypothetical protein
MTVPTSSATPSPPIAFLHPSPVSLVAAIDSGNVDATEREARQQAIQKFLARAEISKVSPSPSLPGWYGTRRVSATTRVSSHV